jgi:hypothetical protein
MWWKQEHNNIEFKLENMPKRVFGINTSCLETDNIVTKYHPYSGHKASVTHLGDWRQEEEIGYSLEKNPWAPFATRIDFEISELALDTSLSREQRERLINLINKAISLHNNDEERFTL